MSSTILRDVLPFDVIVSDPPWMFSDKLPGRSRGAENNYNVMTARDICAIGANGSIDMCGQRVEVAKDAHLFLWRVAAMQQEALDVAKAWGFTVKSEIVWLKRTIHGFEHFGMGRQVRMSHEVCLICTSGRGAGIVNRSQRSTFAAAAGKHSSKPGEFYAIVEGLFGQNVRRLELFARASRIGWTCLGDEL